MFVTMKKLVLDNYGCDGRKEKMNVLLRESQQSDIPFLREMLYEAVFWRATASWTFDKEFYINQQIA